MSDKSYEIEIKSLLGSKDNADALIRRMRQYDAALKELGRHKQLNHYFQGGNLSTLATKVKTYLNAQKAAELEELAQSVKDFSLRTRWIQEPAGEKVILVVKASVDETTASNGTARREFESPVNLSLEELDKILLASGFSYLSKWSRERQEFRYKNVTVTVDKNAGYGYLAEFEMVQNDPALADASKFMLRNMMEELEVAELNQDRLARMFDFYNQNWPDYYGTDKVFNIE
jgi:adenylate cyclase class IV